MTERIALTPKQLLERAKKDLANLRIQFELNERNLIELIKHYEREAR